ncbi:MAG: universal stress protein [Pseudomonadota bacterium]
MFDNILLPVDLDEDASWTQALPAALKCAGSGGRLHILGIVHDLGGALVASYLPDDFAQHAMERLKADLAAFAAREVPADRALEVHVAHGHVAETILRIASDLGADLIVMASHPPSDLRTFLVGSQAEKVVRHATIPTMVVR